MLKNTVEPVRPQTTVWRVRIARWLSKATNAHSEYVILLLFHCNNGCTHAPQCYVTRTLPVLLLRKERLQTVPSAFYWSAAIWLCYVVLYSRCSTASSASQKTYNPIKWQKRCDSLIEGVPFDI
jgi:hypothetical protein